MKPARIIILLAALAAVFGCAKKPAIPAFSGTVAIGNDTLVFHHEPAIHDSIHTPAPLKPFVSEVFTFGFDSDSIIPGNYGRMPSVCRKANAEGLTLRVTGYADSTRSGKYPERASAAYNMMLSGSRAQNIATGLKAAGCRIGPVIAAGDTRKFGAPARNRRVIVEKAD